MQRPVQRRKAIVVDAEEIAREGPGQIASVFEEVKRSVEASVARQGPRLVLEEDLTYPLKAEAWLHLIGLRGPVRQVDVAARDGVGAIGLEVDALQVHARTVEDELRFHVR